MKSANPTFNEFYKIDVSDPEKTQIIIRYHKLIALRQLLGSFVTVCYLFIVIVNYLILMNRFSNGKKATTYGKDKTYLGEVKFELRSAVRGDFSSPSCLFKWFPIKIGDHETGGEAKIFIEFTDLRM